MKPLAQLKIDQPYIALFASGSSINDISMAEFEAIKSKAFVVTMNYAPLKWSGHMNMWSDKKVSLFLEKHYAKNPKRELFLVREGRITNGIKSKVDYVFSAHRDGIKGNYTLVWAIQLFQKYFPGKTLFLFGVDMYTLNEGEAKWYDSYTSYDKEKRGTKYNIRQKLLQCEKQLRRYTKNKNIINCNPKSQLDYFPKKAWEVSKKKKVLHLCMTPLAGAPVHLSNILNKYSDWESKTILRGHFSRPNVKNLKWDYDIVRPSSGALEKWVDWADIIHYHRKIYPIKNVKKPKILQYHSPPGGYQPNVTDKEFNSRKLVIAQYHPRYYTDARVVPNMIDIWSSEWTPAKKHTQKIKIFFSWATEVKGGWADKGSTKTISILKKIENRYPDLVEIKILNNRPYSECMKEKRTAHICIDECVTGSYHLQSLEGCAVGALTFNNIDAKTAGFISAITGVNDYPFEKCGLENLFQRLCFFIDHPNLLQERGAQSRRWMEQHWDPKRLCKIFIDCYENVMDSGSVYTPTLKFQKTNVLPKSAGKTVVQNVNRIASPMNSVQKQVGTLYQKYFGRDIFIFGTGPSLFKINPDKFKDKICLGVNFAFEIMPHIDYTLIHVKEVFEAIKDHIPATQLILPETLVSQWGNSGKRRSFPNRVNTPNIPAYIYPIQNPNIKSLDQKRISLGKTAPIFTWSTTLHSATHIAAYLGARRIFLIGVDYQPYPNGNVHFDSKFYPYYGKQKWQTFKKHKGGDIWIEKKLEELGVSVINLGERILSNSKYDFNRSQKNKPKNQ